MFVASSAGLICTTFAGIGKAAAGGGGQQTPTLVKGVLPTACTLDLPTVAARTGIQLRCDRTDVADIYTEESVTPAIREALANAVARDTATLEQEFGHTFSSRPAIYAFATRNSFAFGLQEIFGVRGPDAGLLAVANGGITLPRQGAIAINLQNVPSDKDFAIVRHELTHALVHETIGVDATRAIHLDPLQNPLMARVYRNSDVGLFPNRCEGGTNLVLMEYMACGLPAIASFGSGHKDVLTHENSLPLERLRQATVRDGDEPPKIWHDAELEEIVEKLEWAYANRERLAELGRRAAQDMTRFTWAATARRFLELLGSE